MPCKGSDQSPESDPDRLKDDGDKIQVEVGSSPLGQVSVQPSPSVDDKAAYSDLDDQVEESWIQLEMDDPLADYELVGDRVSVMREEVDSLLKNSIWFSVVKPEKQNITLNKWNKKFYSFITCITRCYCCN